MKTSITKLAIGLTLILMNGIAMAEMTQINPDLIGKVGQIGQNWMAPSTDKAAKVCEFCHYPKEAISSLPLARSLLSPTLISKPKGFKFRFAS